MDRMHNLLLADVGGTNTRIALGGPDGIVPGSVRRYANAAHPALESALCAYLAETGTAGDLAGACIAAAGPVRDGVATLTNLDWVIRPETVGAAIGAARVLVLNDLQAQGHALGRIAPDALRRILPGRPAPPDASRLVIGIGTGFNAAPVHETAAGRIVVPAESGQVSLPVQCETDLQLMRFLSGDAGYTAIEDVLSGRGIAALHAFACAQAGRGTPQDPAGVMALLTAGDAEARTAAAIFVRLMGAVAGDLALTHLPFGGIYLIGGVARSFAPLLDGFGFAAAFRAKGRFASMMDNFPIHLIEDDYAALTGCLAALEHPPSNP